MLGLPDKYIDILKNGIVTGAEPKPGTDGLTDIMGLGSQITEENITSIIENPNNNVIKRTNGADVPPVSQDVDGQGSWSIDGGRVTGTRCNGRLDC